jgi:hypothetical protein
MKTRLRSAPSNLGKNLIYGIEKSKQKCASRDEHEGKIYTLSLLLTKASLFLLKRCYCLGWKIISI